MAFKTQDIGMAAFFKIRAVPLLDYEYRGNRTIFVFDDSSADIKGLEIEWQNSDLRKYDAELRALKKISLGRPQNGKEPQRVPS